MVQAWVPSVRLVLQAEAKALLLPAKISELLGINKPIFLTDNKLLAKAVASNRLENDYVHWDTKHTLA
jgi:hypothetical protein